MDPQDDADCDKWMAAYAKGDESMVGKLFDKTLDTIFKCASAGLRVRDEQTLFDFAQDVWTKIHLARTSYESRPGVRFEPWLKTIVNAHIVDLLRKKSRATFVPLAESHEPAAEDRRDVAVITEALEKGLNLLDEEDRIAYVMVFRDGCSYVEIAEKPGGKADTWRQRMNRAVVRLHGPKEKKGP
ncbi:MAG TPA: sigma-70 family RNA polymerase sigma factor [Planctomycetota bacterium]|nr:sigma-70 family RNA polymerase sigma factor [Planctomycetota bacterium]